MAFSYEESKQILDMLQVGVARIGLDGHFLEVNPGYETLTGYSEAELLSLKWQDITPPGDREMDQKMVEAIISGERTMYDMDKSYNRKNNGLVFISLRVKGQYDQAGKLNHFLVTAIPKPHMTISTSGKHTVTAPVVSSNDATTVGKLIFRNWRWIILAVVGVVGSLSAWLANIEATHGRVDRNETRIERMESTLNEILSRLPPKSDG